MLESKTILQLDLDNSNSDNSKQYLFPMECISTDF